MEVEEKRAAAGADSLAEKSQFMAHGLDLQGTIQGVATLGNTLMTVVFAAHSLTSLFEILSDDTLSPMEKLNAGAMDFAMVLAMTAPLISSAIGSFKGLRTAIKAVSMEQVGMKIVQASLGKSTAALTLAEFIATIQTHGLATAFKSLWITMVPLLVAAAPYIAAIAGIGLAIWGIVKAVQAADEHFHEFDIAVEEAGKKVDEANAYLKQAKEEISEVSTALEKIKSSDDAFDGLQQGTLEWTEALYEANNQVQQLIEKYPSLAKFITTGTYGQMTLTQEGQREAARLAQESFAKAQTQSLVAQREYVTAKNNQTAINEARSAFGGIVEANTSYYGDGYSAYGYTDNQGVVNDITALAEGYKQAVLDGERERFINEKNLTTEQVQALETLNKTIAENTLALNAQEKATAASILATDKNYQNASMGAKNVMQNMIAAELQEGSDTWKKAAENVKNNWGSEAEQRKAYAEQRGWVQAGDKFYRSQEDALNGQNAINWDAVGDVEQLLTAAEAEALVLKENSSAITRASLAYENIEDSIGKNAAKIFAGNGKIDFSNITPGDLADFDPSKLLSELSFQDLKELGFNSYEEFKDAFNAASEANPLIPQIDVDSKYDFDNDVEIDQYLKNNTDIDRETLDTATSLRVQEHGAEGNKFNIENTERVVAAEQALQDIRDTMPDDTLAIAAAEERLAKAKEDVTKDEQAYEKAVQRAAAAEARQIKTIKEMNEHFEENTEILQTAEKGSIEYAEALQQTKEDLAGLLDIDADKLSNEFVASAETLDLMRQSAEGNEEAFRELQYLAAQDLIANIKVSDSFTAPDGSDATAYVQEQLTGLIDALNAENLGIDVEADIGTEEWYARINELLASGAITADQLTQVLSAAGYEGIIETEKGKGSVTKTTYELSYGGTTTIGEGAGKITMPTSISMIPHYETVEGQDVDIPVLKGATQKGGITNAAGSANRGSSGKGGGGGGGGSKAKSVKKAEGAKSNVDPYNKVNNELEKLADNYTEISNAQDRMYGDRYRRAAEAEIKNLQEQNDKLRERIVISEKIAEALRTGQDNPDYGIYLDDESLNKYGLVDEDLDGTIDNYIDIYNQALAAQNAAQKAADDYWASTGGEMTDEQSTRYSELQEAQKDAAEYANKITDVTNKYQETMDKIRDDTQQIQDNMYEIEDKVIDIWNYAKDAAKELGEFREDQIDLAETLATLWGDDAVKSLGFAFDRFTNMFEANEKSLADAIVDYQNRLNKATDENMKQWYQDQIDLAQKAMANGTSVLDLNMQRMNEIYKAIDEWKESGVSELFGSNEKAMWEAFDEAWEDAVDYAKKLKGYIEDIHDNIGQVMDDMYDAMDRRNDLFDQVESQYEYLKDMTELIHGEKAYDMLERITRKQAQAGEERLKTLEEERKANHDMLEGLEEGSEEYLKALEKEQELDDNIRDIRKDITDTYKEAKELANELAVQNWLDNFTANINGVEVPLEYAADQWERIKENADNYLDDLNRAWELEKLENEYLKLIDDAVDPNIQKQITKQMEEQLGYLREKDKLSEYDVKYANAQLEILQKTIALEDARANKNQMKLRRDSQGNYSYVYAANRNDVRDKENDLLDARMNGYNMSVEASRDATDDYFNHIQTMADRIRDAANDASLSAEQIDAITQDIIEYGYDYLRAKGEQLTTAQKNGIESYIQAAKELSELNAGNVLDMSRQLEEGLIDDLGMVTDVFHNAVKDWVEGPEGLNYAKTAADQMGRDVVRNVEDFVIAVGEANTNIEEPLSGIETQFVDANTALTNLTASAQDFYNFLEEKSGIVGQAAADLAEYQAALTDMNSKMNEYYDAWEQRGKELESEKAINSQLRIDMNNLQEEYETKLAEAQKRAGGGSGGSGSGGSTDTSNGSVVGYSGRYYSDSWGNGPSGNWFADQPGAVRISSFSRRSGYGDYNIHLETLNGGHLGWVKESQLFDTGGYTGAWGPGGKAAILHEKELVLNAQDTQNMLAADSVVRGLVEMFKGTTFNLNNMSQRGFASNGIGNNVEQRVEITAEFPNVRSAADIETALLNLSNNAYQYAYNKNEKFM